MARFITMPRDVLTLLPKKVGRSRRSTFLVDAIMESPDIDLAVTTIAAVAAAS